MELINAIVFELSKKLEQEKLEEYGRDMYLVAL